MLPADRSNRIPETVKTWEWGLGMRLEVKLAMPTHTSPYSCPRKELFLSLRQHHGILPLSQVHVFTSTTFMSLWFHSGLVGEDVSVWSVMWEEVSVWSVMWEDVSVGSVMWEDVGGVCGEDVCGV